MFLMHTLFQGFALRTLYILVSFVVLFHFICFHSSENDLELHFVHALHHSWIFFNRLVFLVHFFHFIFFLLVHIGQNSSNDRIFLYLFGVFRYVFKDLSPIHRTMLWTINKRRTFEKKKKKKNRKSIWNWKLETIHNYANWKLSTISLY